MKRPTEDELRQMFQDGRAVVDYIYSLHDKYDNINKDRLDTINTSTNSKFKNYGDLIKFIKETSDLNNKIASLTRENEEYKQKADCLTRENEEYKQKADLLKKKEHIEHEYNQLRDLNQELINIYNNNLKIKQENEKRFRTELQTLKNKLQTTENKLQTIENQLQEVTSNITVLLDTLQENNIPYPTILDKGLKYEITSWVTEPEYKVPLVSARTVKQVITIIDNWINVIEGTGILEENEPMEYSITTNPAEIIEILRHRNLNPSEINKKYLELSELEQQGIKITIDIIKNI